MSKLFVKLQLSFKMKNFLSTSILSIILCAIASDYAMTPDENYYGGSSSTMTPDGGYVGGDSYNIALDGSYQSGSSSNLMSDSTYK